MEDTLHNRRPFIAQQIAMLQFNVSAVLHATATTHSELDRMKEQQFCLC